MHRRAMKDPDPNEDPARPVLACLGEPSRFRLVRALAVSDRCVGELAEEVGLSQSCTTRHLQALERVGLVAGHREGRRVRFRLRADAPDLTELLGWALSGAGQEARADGHDGSRGGPSARPAPVAGGRKSRSAAIERPRGGDGRPSAARSGTGGVVGSSSSSEPGPNVIAGPRPTRGTNELEDYLL